MENLAAEKNIENEYKVPILNVLGALFILFGVIFGANILLDLDHYEVAGSVILLSGIVLNYVSRKIPKSKWIFKLSNLLYFALFTTGLSISLLNFFEFAEVNDQFIYATKLIEIPAIILSIYLYIKNKNQYMLFIPFLLLNVMIFLAIETAEFYDNFVYDNLGALLMLVNIIILLSLEKFGYLVTGYIGTFRIFFVALNLFIVDEIYDYHAFPFIEAEGFKYLMMLVVFDFLIYGFAKLMNGARFDYFFFLTLFGLFFTVDYFDSILFISLNLIALTYGLLKDKKILCSFTFVVLVISLDSLMKFQDYQQVFYFIIAGILLIGLNIGLNKQKEKKMLKEHIVEE